MSCDCHTRVEASCKEKIASQLPEGYRDLSVELGGYVFGIESNTVTHRAAMPVTANYFAPKKGGGMKSVKQTIQMRATYCPFCGAAYAKPE